MYLNPIHMCSMFGSAKYDSDLFFSVCFNIFIFQRNVHIFCPLSNQFQIIQFRKALPIGITFFFVFCVFLYVHEACFSQLYFSILLLMTVSAGYIVLIYSDIKGTPAMTNLTFIKILIELSKIKHV